MPTQQTQSIDMSEQNQAWTLCHKAHQGDLDALRKVFEEGGNLDVADYDGRTPLHLAAAGGHLSVVTFLVEEAGCKMHRDRFNSLPLHDAHRGGHKEVKVYLQKLVSPSDAALLSSESNGAAHAWDLCHKAHQGDLEGLRKLYLDGADLNMADYDGRTSLHLAAAGGHLEVVKFLVEEAGCTMQRDRFNCLPITDAERGKHQEVQKYLRDILNSSNTTGLPFHSPTEGRSFTDQSRNQGIQRVPTDPPAPVTIEGIMPPSYLMRAQDNPGLQRVHMKAIQSYCGAVDPEDTTMVVQHRFSNGFVVSVLDTQNSGGSLLYTIKNALPQTDRILHAVDVFTSLDDNMVLSVFHYCHEYLKLEKAGEAAMEGVIKFSERVQLGEHVPKFPPQRDYSQDHLKSWLQQCTAYYVRCTEAGILYRMYLYDKTMTTQGQSQVDWTMPEDLSADLPSRNADLWQIKGKQNRLSRAFWIYGHILGVPNLRVVEATSQVLLRYHLIIERAHTTTMWKEMGNPSILLNFLVLPSPQAEGDTSDIKQLADTTVAALREALAAEAVAPPPRATASPPRNRLDSDDDSSENEDSSVDAPEVPSPPRQGELCGYLLKQRQSGMIRLWQKRRFELTGSILSYNNPNEPQLFKSFDLQNFTLSISDARKHAFTLTEIGGKVVLRLACSSEQERKQWCAAITAAQKEVETKQKGTARKDMDREAEKEKEKDAEWDGETLHRYQRISGLGRGTSGKVWKVRDKETGELLALKMMDKSHIMKQNLEKSVMAEKGILENLRHPFVIRLHSAFQTPTKLCLVLDYYPGGTLQTLLDKWSHFPEPLARFYGIEMALALKYLHSINIIHRDLKPTNVLLNSEGHAIVTDFGIAIISTEAHTFCGTPHYIAPEVLVHKGYTKAVDWWCYGVLMYQMLSGSLPFVAQTGLSGATIYRNIMTENPNFDARLLSVAASSLLQGLLEKDPGLRIGYDRLAKHPFFNGVDWDAALKMKIPRPQLPDT